MRSTRSISHLAHKGIFFFDEVFKKLEKEREERRWEQKVTKDAVLLTFISNALFIVLSWFLFCCFSYFSLKNIFVRV
jgi:hypothetical protein